MKQAIQSLCQSPSIKQTEEENGFDNRTLFPEDFFRRHIVYSDN